MRTHSLILALVFSAASIDLAFAAEARKPARPQVAFRRADEPMRRQAIPPTRLTSAAQAARIMQSGQRATTPAPVRPGASSTATAGLVMSRGPWVGVAAATASSAGLSPMLLPPFVVSALVPVLLDAALTTEPPPSCRCESWP